MAKNAVIPGDKILLFDGGLGTELILDGANFRSPEEYLLKKPERVLAVHRSYVLAGADIIETNTFGANRLKLAQVGLEKYFRLINQKALAVAKKAAAGRKVLIAGSVGPTGRFLKPLGDLSFDEAYEVFSEQIRILAQAGPDLICLETFSDLAEARAALIAAKENSKLPVVVNLTFTEKGATFSGNSPEAAAVVLKSLGARAVGLNCGFGPDLALPIVERLSQLRKEGFDFLISALPNAGKPRVIKNKVVYSTTPAQFAEGLKKLIEAGADLVGGCCGSGPEYIRQTKKIMSGLKIKKQEPSRIFGVTWLASPSKVHKISPDGGVTLIGDRVNPSGRPNLVKSLTSGNWELVFQELKAQAARAADVLDINVAHPEIDEKKILPAVVGQAQRIVTQPLSLDTANPEALEEALKIYPGRPIINSTTASPKKLAQVLPLAKRFGAVVIGLTFDEAGLPKNAGQSLKIAQKILKAAEKFGLAQDDILIDPLVLALGSTGSAAQTLDSLKLIKEKLGVKTVLGIGNISHGLPDRALINSHFLSLAIYQGLAAAIANPLSPEIQAAWRIGNYLAGRDFQGRTFLKHFQKSETRSAPKEKTGVNKLQELKQAIIDAEEKSALEAAKKFLLENKKPYQIIDEAVIPAMKIVGGRFSRGEYFLPQLQAAAAAARAVMKFCQKKLAGKSAAAKGRVLMATVEGDIHDLGKNLVALMLKNSGFEVLDLGKNVSNAKIMAAVKKFRPAAVCLSSLLTTTMPRMKELKKLLETTGLKVPLVVGGAVVTPGFAKSFGAFYAKDAVAAVQVVGQVTHSKKQS